MVASEIQIIEQARSGLDPAGEKIDVETLDKVGTHSNSYSFASAFSGRHDYEQGHWPAAA
jgi:hypothetical protein